MRSDRQGVRSYVWVVICVGRRDIRGGGSCACLCAGCVACHGAAAALPCHHTAQLSAVMLLHCHSGVLTKIHTKTPVITPALSHFANFSLTHMCPVRGGVKLAFKHPDCAGICYDISTPPQCSPLLLTTHTYILSPSHSLTFFLTQVRDRDEAARISNAYAPEHLIVNVKDAESWLSLLDNAGSVFLGRWAHVLVLVRLAVQLLLPRHIAAQSV